MTSIEKKNGGGNVCDGGEGGGGCLTKMAESLDVPYKVIFFDALPHPLVKNETLPESDAHLF